jgi:hypothetical protein
MILDEECLCHFGIKLANLVTEKSLTTLAIDLQMVNQSIIMTNN